MIPCQATYWHPLSYPPRNDVDALGVIVGTEFPG
jgi:hypothetical protein